MARRKQTVPVHCHEPGCKEHSFYEADSNTDAFRIRREYGDNWMCTRHSQPGALLTPANLVRTTRKVAREIPDRPLLKGKLFWDGDSGFTFGDGYKAFAQDFPPGTVIEVTARIILPPAE